MTLVIFAARMSSDGRCVAGSQTATQRDSRGASIPVFAKYVAMVVVGRIEINFEIVFKMQLRIIDVEEATVERHALARECTAARMIAARSCRTHTATSWCVGPMTRLRRVLRRCVEVCARRLSRAQRPAAVRIEAFVPI